MQPSAFAPAADVVHLSLSTDIASRLLCFLPSVASFSGSMVDRYTPGLYSEYPTNQSRVALRNYEKVLRVVNQVVDLASD